MLFSTNSVFLFKGFICIINLEDNNACRAKKKYTHVKIKTNGKSIHISIEDQ